MAQDCDKFSSWLLPMLDGALSPVEERELSAHLKDCEACRAELRKLVSVRSALLTISAPTLPEDFHFQVSSRAAKEFASSKRISFLPRILAAAAALLLLLFGSFIIYGLITSPPPVDPMLVSQKDSTEELADKACAKSKRSAPVITPSAESAEKDNLTKPDSPEPDAGMASEVAEDAKVKEEQAAEDARNAETEKKIKDALGTPSDKLEGDAEDKKAVPLYYTEKDEDGRLVYVIKGGRLVIKATEDTIIRMPHFGQLRLSAGTTVVVAVLTKDLAVSTGPELSLLETAKTSIIAFEVTEGSAQYICPFNGVWALPNNRMMAMGYDSVN